MDLKDMIVTVVYQSPGGLFPLEIVDEMDKRFSLQTNTKRVLEIIEKNKKLFLTDENGRIKCPLFGESR